MPPGSRTQFLNPKHFRLPSTSEEGFEEVFLTTSDGIRIQVTTLLFPLLHLIFVLVRLGFSGSQPTLTIVGLSSTFMETQEVCLRLLLLTLAIHAMTLVFALSNIVS